MRPSITQRLHQVNKLLIDVLHTNHSGCVKGTAPTGAPCLAMQVVCVTHHVAVASLFSLPAVLLLQLLLLSKHHQNTTILRSVCCYAVVLLVMIGVGTVVETWVRGGGVVQTVDPYYLALSCCQDVLLVLQMLVVGRVLQVVVVV